MTLDLVSSESLTLLEKRTSVVAVAISPPERIRPALLAILLNVMVGSFFGP